MNYYNIPPLSLSKGAKIPIRVLPSSRMLFRRMAEEMAITIQQNNVAGERTVFILPVGPTGQYDIFVQMVNRRKISLKNCWFFHMDEYLDQNGELIDMTLPISFRGYMEEHLHSRIRPDLVMPKEQWIFPDPSNPTKIDEMLEEFGGADICFGGIGMNGHIAFNEPNSKLTVEEFSETPTRIVRLSEITRAINADNYYGGKLDQMPCQAVTIGMKSILASHRVILGVFRPWHRAVCRRAAFGKVTANYPVSLLQKHPDVLLYVNDVAAQLPVPQK